MKNDQEITRLEKLRRILKPALFYTLFVLSANAIALTIDSLLLGHNMLHYFTLFTLGEAGILFLMGGALDVSGSVSYHVLKEHGSKAGPSWNAEHHRRSQTRAAPLVATGLLLLATSFLLAYPLN